MTRGLVAALLLLVNLVGCVGHTEFAAGNPDTKANTDSSPVDEASVAADELGFSKIIVYKSGFMEWGWWKLTLDSTGVGTLTYSGRGSPRSVSFSPAQLRRIDRAIRDAEFMEMDEAYSGGMLPDEAVWRTITVVTPKSGIKKVTVLEAPRDIGKKKGIEVRHFFDVWLAIRYSIETTHQDLRRHIPDPSPSIVGYRP